jgi:hypothetical protein
MASPIKMHFSTSQFIGGIQHIPIDRIIAFEPYRVVTEEGFLPLKSHSHLGITTITTAIERVGFVERQFAIWVMPQSWWEADEAPTINEPTIRVCFSYNPVIPYYLRRPA